MFIFTLLQNPCNIQYSSFTTETCLNKFPVLIGLNNNKYDLFFLDLLKIMNYKLKVLGNK